MASPGDKKGQHKGSCGHITASLHSHNKCTRCRDKRIGEDNCVLDKPCPICDGFSDSEKELLATPAYRIRKEKKAGLLVSPKDVTVISSLDNEPTFQSPSCPSVQSSAQLSSPIQPTMASSSSEQFARMEALLSHGNIFSTPVSTVKPVDSQHLISETPFMAPATRLTGPLKVPVAADASVKPKLWKKKPKRKLTNQGKQTILLIKTLKQRPRLTRSMTGLSHRHQNILLQLNRDVLGPPLSVASSGPESAKQLGAEKIDIHQPPSGSEQDSTGLTGHTSSVSHQPGYGHFSASACAYPSDMEETLFEQISDEDVDRSGSFSGSSEGQLSDSTETPEQTEDVTYRETVCSVRSFMCWHHIPTFESDYSELDKSNNPWKGKQPRKPTRISVAMPSDHRLCQKLECLNLTVAGYPSRAQDSAGLKRDQFIKVPKSQSRWYKMHLIDLDVLSLVGTTLRPR